MSITKNDVLALVVALLAGVFVNTIFGTGGLGVAIVLAIYISKQQYR